MAWCAKYREIARIAIKFSGSAYLDFKITCGDLQCRPGFSYQHVGQNWQGVPTLNDAGYRLQNR
jgi:hypothetical protein